jgi:SET domain-containing protein
MMLVRSYLALSPIHGFGLFADELIRAGQPIWRLDSLFDRVWSEEQYHNMPIEALKEMEGYATWCEPQKLWLYCVDNARFFNHSDDPNVLDGDMRSWAARSIKAGEELTCCYSSWAQIHLLNRS